MRLREFLIKSSQAALGCSCMTSLTRAQKNPKDYLSLGAVVSAWEKQIPSLMEKFLVPGLSVAIVNEGKLSWRRGFGVKVSSSNEAVENDTNDGRTYSRQLDFLPQIARGRPSIGLALVNALKVTDEGSSIIAEDTHSSRSAHILGRPHLQVIER